MHILEQDPRDDRHPQVVGTNLKELRVWLEDETAASKAWLGLREPQEWTQMHCMVTQTLVLEIFIHEYLYFFCGAS